MAKQPYSPPREDCLRLSNQLLSTKKIHFKEKMGKNGGILCFILVIHSQLNNYNSEIPLLNEPHHAFFLHTMAPHDNTNKALPFNLSSSQLTFFDADAP